MISCQMDFGSWNEGSEALHKLHGSEFDGKGAITPWFFESVDDFPSDVGGESFFGERRSGNVSANLFEFFSFLRFGGNSCVKREA